MLQMVMSKLSLKVYLMCGYAILALLFLPAPVFANTNCAKNLKACNNKLLCAFATQLIYKTRNTTNDRKWADGDWRGHVTEANRRVLSCGIKTQNSTYNIVKSAYRVSGSEQVKMLFNIVPYYWHR